MRPLDSPSSFDFTAYTLPIYESVLVRFKAADLDQEVKERAISCMGFIVAHLGDHFSGKFHEVTHSTWLTISRFNQIQPFLSSILFEKKIECELF